MLLLTLTRTYTGLLHSAQRCKMLWLRRQLHRCSAVVLETIKQPTGYGAPPGDHLEIAMTGANLVIINRWMLKKTCNLLIRRREKHTHPRKWQGRFIIISCAWAKKIINDTPPLPCVVFQSPLKNGKRIAYQTQAVLGVWQDSTRSGRTTCDLTHIAI